MANATDDTLTGHVLDALRSVYDPDLKRDLVSLNMIRDLRIAPNGAVDFRIVLTTPACPVKDLMEKQAREAVLKVSGVTSVAIKMDAEVRGRAGNVKTSIPGVTHIIAVSSGKGGVGKSTVSVNLAVSLALEGARVGLMDGDIHGPNIPTMMGVTEMPTIEKDAQGVEKFIPPSAHGVKVMSMGFLVPTDQPMIWRGPMLHSAVQQFTHQVNWGELDYLVVDMPPGTGDVQLSLAQLVPVTGAVLVTTPQEVSMQDVRRAFTMWEKVRIPILGVVENMSFFRAPDTGKEYSIFGSGGGQLLAKKFKTDLLAQLPIVPEIREGGDIGRPLTLSQPEAEPSKLFRALARTVAQRVSILVNETVDPSQIVQIGKFY